MRVDSIKNGIVIDHIDAGRATDIYDMLSLDKLDCPIAILKNVPSEKMGKKDIIKIDSELAFSLPVEILGAISRNITVVTVKDGEVASKKQVSLPLEIRDFLRCKNPRCITSTEQELSHVFRLTDPEKRIYRCLWCETQAER